jgi:hypothetical protein
VNPLQISNGPQQTQWVWQGRRRDVSLKGFPPIDLPLECRSAFDGRFSISMEGRRTATRVFSL